MDESCCWRKEDVAFSVTPLEDELIEWFALLKKCKEREGHANVHQKKHKEDERNLGMWLRNYRMAKKGKREKLNLSQEECHCEEIGVSFDRYSD